MRDARPASRNVLRLLREPRWLRGLALAVLVALVCCALGRWQWHRREERLAANAPLVQNYDAAPVPVDSVLGDGQVLAPGDVWTPVRLTGTYDTDATVLVRNRPRDERFGYEVLVPLVQDDGTALLVDRGWLPAGDDSTERPDAVPAPPAGRVTVVARLRQWEDDKRGRVPAGQVTSIAGDSVTAAVEGALDDPPRLLGGYALLASEAPASGTSPAAVPAPAPAERPAVDEGPHLAYTVQWFGFALTALVVWVVAGRRELQARAEEDQTPQDPTPGTTPGTAQDRAPRGAGTTSAAPPAPRRRRRREGVDEAAEDAELDARVEHR